MEGSKGPGPEASRKDSEDSGPVGEAIPVSFEEGPAGNGAPPRSGPAPPPPPSPPPRPPEEIPQSRRGPRTVGFVGRAGLSVDCPATAATREV